ncbi:unnamed protein product [Rotaria magnacalcarata]|uniref:Apple domain-containing protein n=1 Tax=Rotaria magnacalcarata TaxID=392030 RepID=A0A815X8I9_9BILA|nr:unnamed protein product [Rotaria magnacalcarata]
MSSSTHAIYSSTLSLSLQGYEFQPQYGVQLVFNETAQSLILCSTACNQNPSCRIFDYDSSSHRCRLFEADLTNGAIIAAASQTSIVGSGCSDNNGDCGANATCSYNATINAVECTCTDGYIYTGSASEDIRTGTISVS